MDSGQPSVAAAPAPDYDQMWRDYSGWETDVREHYGSELSTLETNFAFGRGISAEAYAGSRSRLEREMGEELGALKRGPTYQMLRDNWKASGSDLTLEDFYGGMPQRVQEMGSEAAVRKASPRRGAASGLSGESLLNRDENVTWFFV